MRWVVTGSQGQLGRALVARLEDAGEAVVALGHGALDIGDADAVKRFFDAQETPPDVVANAAAFTHVDRCETQADDARRVNAVAPGVLAEVCHGSGIRFVHVSTDYVFPGDAARPYREDDPVAPRSAYGRTKLEGEQRVRTVDSEALVVRTSWVFGHGRNFLVAILDQARLRRRGEAEGPLRVVDDQRGRPTYAVDLALALTTLVGRDARGLYHVANREEASWWDLARACLDASGYEDIEIDRIATDSLDLPAPRPAWSVLDCSRAEALGAGLRSWRDALAAYLDAESSPLRDDERAAR
jgi:dTDP-4-dehydrorhamnose reductase